MKDTFRYLIRCKTANPEKRGVCRKLIFMLLCCFVFAAQIYAQQQIKVSGVVSEESGEPIIGASITILNTTTGTLTDIEGKFTLNVPSNATLKISYIGFTSQEIPVNGKTTINVVLKEDSKLLDEVVVVGYGTQRVKDLTGAATAVQVDDLPNIPGTSIIDALAGQVVGLSVTPGNGRPGSTGSFKVRQPVSFDNAANYNQPLIVIDDVVQVDQNGEPTMTAFNMLNISEIESMTVLKDASAAVYGSRASAGVILVKTKRGSVGKAKISYNGNLDFADAVSHIKTMNAYETGVFTNRMINQTYAISDGKTDYRNKMYSDNELNAMKNLNYNWLDEAWSTSVSQRHSLSVDGGSDRATYFAGISYQDQSTNLGNVQDYDKWTFRTGGEIKVASGLKLSASIAGYNSKKTAATTQAKITSGPWGSQSSSDDYSQLRHIPKYIPWQYEVNGQTQYVSPWMGPIETNTQTDANVSNGYAVWNFFANEASKARTVTEDNGYNANFSLTYDVPFIKGLSLKGTYAVSYSNTFTDQVGDYYKVARATNTKEEGMHLLGDYTTWDFLNYGDPNGTDVSKKPSVTYNKRTSRSEQMNFMFTYNRVFGLHDVGVTGVVERAENEGHEMSMLYQGVQTSYNGTSGTAGTLNTDATKTYLKKYESGALSYIGRAGYKYDNRYLFQFVIRADASTKFAPENYWGTFPTASVGWILSEEKFFQNGKLSGLFDFLKLRYSLGKTGKDNVEAWRWMQIYKIDASSGLGFGTIGGQPSNGANIYGTANRNIKWDTTIKNNIGIDFNVLSNRLAFTADYYYDKTKDLIMFKSDLEEPIYIGAAVPAVNYGKKDAWGLEFSIRWNDKINQSLKPSWGPIKYGIGMDYSISWNKTILGTDPTFDYTGYVDEQSNWTGWRGPGSEWGFRTWKNTSKGDGMLRTQGDIDNYWQYLTDLATAAGTTPSYLGITNKDNMKVGMLAYEDVRGDKDEATKTWKPGNGVISRDHAEDYVDLASKRRHGINTRLSMQWGNFSWAAQLSTQWGGYASIYNDVKQNIGTSSFIWSQLSYVNDMFDPTDNPDGKYPSMAVASAYGEVSDFWQVSTFRCYVRNMTLGYTLPKKLSEKAGIDRLQVTLTGNNLWDFYNPYPDHFRNMYDDARTAYPTLRTWSLGLNLTF